MVIAVAHHMNPAYEPYVFVVMVLVCVAGAMLGGYFVLSALIQLLTHQLTGPEYQSDGKDSECS